MHPAKGHQLSRQREPDCSSHEAGWAIDTNYDILTTDQQQTVNKSAKEVGLSSGKDSKDPKHFFKEVPGGISERSEKISEAAKTYENLTKIGQQISMP